MSENPKHYTGSQKIPFGDVPGIIEAELSLAMAEGAMKYGAYNFRQDPIRAYDYYAAARRHLTEFWELGEDVDGPSGVSHLVKAMATLAVLRDAQINGMMIDDRPPAVSRTAWDHLENVANEMRARNASKDVVPRVTEWPKDEDAEGAAPYSGPLADINRQGVNGWYDVEYGQTHKRLTK